MRRCAIANIHRTSAFAVSSVALLTSCSCSEADDVDDRFGEHRQEPKLPMPWQQQWHALQNKLTVREGNLLNTNHGAYKSRLRSSIAKCEAALNHATSSSTHESNKNNQEQLSMQGMDYYYMKMSPDEMFEASKLDSHAVFGPLLGTNLIERFNVYKRVNTSQSKVLQSDKNEIVVVDIKLGTRLNGHGGVVHGGIISLLIDTALGFAYHICLTEEDKENIAVTANLKVDFRAPLREGSDAVVRTYLDRIEGRKIFFSVVLENKDGSVVYAEATSLFIKINRSKVIVNNN